jgi:midasin
MRQPVTNLLNVDHESKPSTGAMRPFTPLDDAAMQRHDATMPTTANLSEHGTSPLSNLPQALSVFSRLLSGRVADAYDHRRAQWVDDFSSQVIETAQALAQANIPAEKRGSAQKALVTRKRKAWSDLLKELKRIGLTASMKPDVLDRQHSIRWLREQPCPPEEGDGVETYFRRLQAILPELRASLVGHSDDLPTRDVHRAIMFVESSFAYALEARNR